MTSIRSRYCFAQARRCVRVARMYTGETQAAIVRTALLWRRLAKSARLLSTV